MRVEFTENSVILHGRTIGWYVTPEDFLEWDYILRRLKENGIDPAKLEREAER